MTFVWIVLGLLAVILLSQAIFVVRQYERGVVATLGRYSYTADPGLTFIFPFLQSLERVDMRETVLDVAPQEVITEDNVVVTVDAVIYFEVTDPFRRVYNVTDFRLAAMKLAQTNLRNVIGDLELDETLTSRETINAQLRTILDDATDKWGVRVTRVELQRIDPPRDITEAMSRQMKAERNKRAAILEAEGVRESAILEAEGQRQSAILEAEGQAQAIRNVADAEKFREIAIAEGQAKAIVNVYSAIHEGDPTHDLLAIKYLETLQRMANGKATKIFLPIEASGVLAGVAAMADAFEEGKRPLQEGGEA
ncbi:MAG: SPFH/Band 7/PHB domain protein [candidate division WS1 bacterium]|jgi:regulator of protease activity HflC (stomatin/prohibitin superfamily)|nr:SPFH/Band 7/PHB domain protein [candidate division WS1 bacterium]